MEAVHNQKLLAKEKEVVKSAKIAIKDDARFKCMWDFTKQPDIEELKKIDPMSYIGFRK